MCCSSWDHKESDKTEQLNWSDEYLILCFCVSYNTQFMTGN